MELKVVMGLQKIILGSKSPRRRELLAGLDIEFTVDSQSNFDETYPADMEHILVPEYIAKGKSEHFHRPLQDDEILVTADTMVLLNGSIMGKPRDHSEAVEMISALSGNRHIVATGVCIRSNTRTVSFTDITYVTFCSFSPQEIEYYVNRYKPYDKAGAYGIQEWIGLAGISSVEGSYFNVMGLPVHRVYNELKSFK